MSEVDKATREMLAAIRAEKREAQQRVRDLEAREKTVEGWLNGSGQTSLIPEDYQSSPTLKSILVAAVKLSQLNNRELAALARGKGAIFKDLRSINSIMNGLKRADLVDSKNGKWFWK